MKVDSNSNKQLITPIQGFLFFAAVVVLLISWYFFARAYEDHQFDKCSRYTIAKVERVKHRNLKAWIVYSFTLNNKKVEYDNPANPTDTGDWLKDDENSLIKRRFWIRVYCNDYDVHRLLWKPAVPETLKYIPNDGWTNAPFERKTKE